MRVSKPRLHQYQDVFQMERRLQELHQSRVQRMNEEFQSQQQEQDLPHFNLPAQVCREITRRKFSTLSWLPSGKAVRVEHSLRTGQPNYSIPTEELEEQVPEEGIPRFPGLKKGVPNLPQYRFNEKTVYVFNLPHDVTREQLVQSFKFSVRKIEFGFCLLGLPAYAMIQFESAEAVENIVFEQHK